MFGFLLKRKLVKGQIVSVDDDKIVVAVKRPKLTNEIGKFVRVTIPAKVKTTTGQYITISHILAQGQISLANGSEITINSKSSDLIIAKRARLDAGNTKPIVCVRFLDFS